MIKDLQNEVNEQNVGIFKTELAIISAECVLHKSFLELALGSFVKGSGLNRLMMMRCLSFSKRIQSIFENSKGVSKIFAPKGGEATD